MKLCSSAGIRSVIGILLVTYCGVLHAVSEEVLLKSFGADSLGHITSAKSNKPFMMVLWSIDCPPCMKELLLFKEFKRQLSKDNIVLISTDGTASVSVIQKTLADYQLEQLDNWVFSNEMAERIRYAIDPQWYGELPRTYFYDSDGNRQAHSGMLTRKLLGQWLKYSHPTRSIN